MFCNLFLRKNKQHHKRIKRDIIRSKRVMNLNDNTPAKGASSGNIGRGPFTKNFVIPKDPVNKLKINV